MSRDSNGNYTLPAGNPVVSDTVIDSVWANDTMSDLATTLTNSLDRDGKGGMRAPLKLPDSSAATPSFSFVNQTNTGMYRAGDGDLRFSVGGTDGLRLTTGAFLSMLSTATVSFVGGNYTFAASTIDFSGGVYTFDTTGLETFDGDLFIGDAASGKRVLAVGDVTAEDVIYDNTITGQLPATNVQAAIDQLSAGSGFVYGSAKYSGGGTLAAGILNVLTDSDTYFLPLASSTAVGTVIRIALPSTYQGQTPLVQVSGADTVTWQSGVDTELQFLSPSVALLTSNGVDTWEY